jgi:hypothetical protein
MMKRYVALAVVGLIVGYVAQSNFWFEDERDIFFPITKEQLQTKVRATKVARAEAQGLNAPDILAAIYNKKVLTQELQQKDYFSKIETYFIAHSGFKTQPVSMQKSSLELKNKLSFLMALSTNWNVPQKIVGFEAKNYAQFLKSLAQNKNEHLLVRKQAYKNWLNFTHEEVASNAQSTEKVRLAQLVTFSDAQMIDSLSQNEN